MTEWEGVIKSSDRLHRASVVATAINGAFIRQFVVTCCLLFATVAVTNYAVDPFELYHERMDGLDRTPAKFINPSLLRLAQANQARFDQADPWVIIGDSTTNQIDPEILNRIQMSEDKARRWLNLSYAGATLSGTLSMLEYALAAHNPKAVFFNLPFHRLKSGQRNPIRAALDKVERPFAQLLSFESLRASISVLGYNTLGIWEYGIGLPSPNVDMTGDQKFRYYTQRIVNGMRSAGWPESDLLAFIQLEEAMKRRGIPIILTRMPEDAAVREQLASKTSSRWLDYRTFLSQRCLIDMNALGWRRGDFRDPLHLTEIKKIDLANLFMRELERPCVQMALGVAARKTVQIRLIRDDIGGKAGRRGHGPGSNGENGD